MGAIAGIVHRLGPPPEAEALDRLAAGVAWRAPRRAGRFEGDGAALLSADFEAATTPPQLAVSDSVVVALQGRLDARATGPTDAVGLREAWAAHGAQSLEGLTGPFAAAIWDRRARALWLCRGPMGEVPLYWTAATGRFAFASDAPALLQLPWVSRGVALENLAEYLSFRYVHAPRTLLRDVFAVPAGHRVRLDAAGAAVERIWRAPWAACDAEVPPARVSADRMDAALSRAVRVRASGLAPVGLLLSGGLDSSAILHHVRAAGLSAVGFTVALEGDPSDESSFAGRVARVMGAEHVLLRLDGRAIEEGLAPAAAAMGQPLPSAAAILQRALYQEARAAVSVLLSGDGGDEILGGRSMELLARQLAGAAAVEHLPPPGRGLVRLVARRAGRTDLAAHPAAYGLERLIGGSAVFDEGGRAGLLSDPGLVRPGLRRKLLEPLYGEVESDPLNEILHVWQRGWLTEDSLARSDRMSASVGLEVRFPMLDQHVVSLCAQLPGGAKVCRRGLSWRTKWPLRQAMAGRLPDQLLNRPKRALPAPLDHWLRTEAGARFLRERVASLVADRDGVFQPAVVRRLAEEHAAGASNHGLKLWTLILFQAWRATLAL